MSFRVLLHPKAAESLEKIREPNQRLIRTRLKELRENPEAKGTQLKTTKFWRTRMGDYLAIYEIKNAEQQVIVLFIGHRSNVYDDFSKIV